LICAAACGGATKTEDPPCTPVVQPALTLASNACDPATTTFSLSSTNRHYPLVPGSLVILEGIDEGKHIRVERRVLDETATIAGITTHVLEAKETIDGAVHEIARNFYVEAEDSTVCYFGEDVEFFENGVLANRDGSWRAGVDGAKPGIIMPGIPAAGQSYFQENAGQIAQDRGRVTAVDGKMTLGGVDYEDIVTIQDSNPLDACAVEEEKLYAPGVGEVGDSVKRLVSFTPALFDACAPVTVVASACDPAVAMFSLRSTNPYYPLAVGSVTVLEGMEDGKRVRVERKVLDETQVVAGVTTHVLEARELIDDELYEIARNFYVEATDGTVCYFGEEVTFFSGGQPQSHKGTWRAGAGGAKPGVIMPAHPAPGQVYFQENAPGVAHDMGAVISNDTIHTLGGIEYRAVVTVSDSNPLDSCESAEEKLYAPGVGEAGDTVKSLVSFTPGH